MERTFVFIKPDGMKKNIVGRIISRYEDKGLRLVAIKQLVITREQAQKHYAEHAAKPFFDGIVASVIGVPVVAMVWEAADVISIVRVMNGVTNGAVAIPGTIRGDFSNNFTENVVHASDSPESAVREIANFFPELGA